MDDCQRVHELWKHGQYREALTSVWKLSPVYDYNALLSSRPRGGDMTLRELVFRACRQAVETAWSDKVEGEKVKQWIDELLGHSPPPALIEHGDGRETKAYRMQMIRAHLSCTRAALQAEDTAFSDDLKSVVQETNLPLAFFRNLVQDLMPEQCRNAHLYQPEATVSLSALLVGQAQRQGVVTTLTLELLPHGSGALYPVASLAFVHRDLAFREAETAAAAHVESLELWRGDRDVRWWLERRDKKKLVINALTGPSMGLAFTLGLAKLLAARCVTQQRG